MCSAQYIINQIMTNKYVKTRKGIVRQAAIVAAILLVVSMVAPAASAQTTARSQVLQDVTNSQGSVNGETWEALHYDLDTGSYTENISWVTNANGVIAEDKLSYVSSQATEDYDYSALGTHQAVYVFGEKYVAVNGDTDYNVELLLDDSPTTQLNTGEALDLEQGYKVHIEEIDVNGGKVLWTLSKDGSSVDSGIAEPNGTAEAQNITYEADIGEYGGVEIIKVHVASVFKGNPSVVTIDGYYQLGTSYKSPSDFETGVYDDAEGGENKALTMNSGEDIELKSDTEKTLFHNASIKTADDSNPNTRRYYFYEEVPTPEPVVINNTETTTPEPSEPTPTDNTTETPSDSTEETNQTATPEPTQEPTETSSETGSENNTSTESPKSGTPTTNGFTALLAISGLLAVTYAVSRKRR